MLLLAVAAPLRRSAPPLESTTDAVNERELLIPQVAHASFKAWPALNSEETRFAVNAGRRHRLHLDEPTRELFRSDTLLGRFGLALAERKAVDRKEWFEACEFFSQVRGKLKAGISEESSGGGEATLVDMAGGHGLVGALGAIFKSRDFDRVLVIDQRKPRAFDAVLSAAVEVAPWVDGRLEYQQRRVGPREPLPHRSAVACVHGCRGLTDKIIAAAAAAEARTVALMPCCYPSNAANAPAALQNALGVPLAADVQRTYDLEAAGYTVRWRAVPPSITPMNRILLASRAAGRGL